MEKPVSLLGSRVPPGMRKSLERRKEWLEKRGRQFKVRQKRQLHPRSLARTVARENRRRLRDLMDLVDRSLLVRLPSLLSASQAFEPVIQKRQDALSDDVSQIIGGIRVQYLQKNPKSEFLRKSKEVGVGVSETNLRELNKVTRSALDVDVFQAEPFLTEQIENYAAQNVSLISKVDETVLSEMEEIVLRGARQGLQAKEISAKIRSRFKIARSRSDLIARDQISKLNGQLSKLRQTNLGVSRYVWRTSLDERVRAEHSARNGMIFEWDAPPSDGHPGEAINCRCYAEPVLEDLI